MKTLLRLLLPAMFIYCFGISSSYGKGYDIPVHTINIIKTDSSGAVAVIHLKNYDTLSVNGIDTFKWAFINNGLSFSGWDYNFCDFANCYYAPNLPSGETDILASKTDGAFQLTVTSFHNHALSETMTVKVWDNKDVNNPDTITITIDATRMGIENAVLPSSFVDVFPNPATDKISLKTNQPGFVPAKAVIFNTLGKTVSEQIISGGTSEIPVYDLPKGIYILSLRDQFGREALKQFVKE